MFDAVLVTLPYGHLKDGVHGMEATPRDLRKIRKHLSAPGLLAVVRECAKVLSGSEEEGRCRHTLTDNLMCGLALFAFSPDFS